MIFVGYQNHHHQQHHVLLVPVQIKYIGQADAASDGSSLDMPPSTTMAAKGVQPHLENLKAKVRESSVLYRWVRSHTRTVDAPAVNFNGNV